MRKFILLPFLLINLIACQTELTSNETVNSTKTENQSTQPNEVKKTATPSTKVSLTPSTTPSAIGTPPALLKDEKDIDNSEKDINKIEQDATSTDTQTIKTNVNWKEFNPIIKGKKYTYTYSLKEGVNDLKTEVVWEITDVSSTGYVLKKSFASSSSNALSAVSVPVALNTDNSPSIIPVVSVGGDKVEPTRNIEVFEKPEKIIVPFKTLDAVKVISKTTSASGEVKTTSWYAKDIGLVKSMQESKSGTYTLELKEYK